MLNQFLTRFYRCVTLILAAGVAAQPVFFTSYAGAQETTQQAAEIIDEATERAIKQAQNAGHPVVALQTNLGTLHLQLYADKAPKSVENFLSYVNDGFYNGTVFHRVIEGFMIQGGGLDIRLREKDTRPPVINEADNGLLNTQYALALARTGDPHSATSQFFINTADNKFLNHISKTATGWGYAVIGKLVGGMRIADWMSKAPTGPAGPFSSDVPLTPLIIKQALLLQ